MREPIRFARLIPGLDLTAAQIEGLLGRLSATGAPRPLVFETWAMDGGILHSVGRTDSGRPVVRSLLASYLPGSELLRWRRPPSPQRAARLRLSPRTLPVGDGAVEEVLRALYGVFAGRRPGESIAVQLVLGPGQRPVQLPAVIPDPSPSLARLLLRGPSEAPAEIRQRVARHASVPRVEVTVRIGVTAAVPERRRQLRGLLLGALATLEAPGVRLSLANESPAAWDKAVPARGALPLTPAQAAGLLAVPLHGLDLPGLPPRHPRRLPPPSGVTNDGAVFATSTAPGRERPVGLTTTSRLQHLAVTGGTGSGKSEIFASLALSDIGNRIPLALIEPKRQLVDAIVARAPESAAGRVVIIDAAEQTPVGFNPLDIGERDPGPVVDGILEVFKAVFADGWGPRTEDLLHAGLLTLDADGRRRGTPYTLLDLVPLISDDGYRRSVVGAVAGDVTLAGYWAAFDGLSPAHRANIAAAPLNKLRKYVLRRNVAAVLGQSRPRFRLRDLWRDPEPKAVLVPLNDALIGPGAAQLLGGLIVAELWLATQERALEDDPKQRPGMVFIDEVQRYLHLPTSIDDALATSRSYGIGWHLALQGRSQVPVQLADALALNARNVVTFAASPKDARALAQTTTALTVEDFQSLGRFEIYADLVVEGAPAGWFSAATLPPAPASGNGELIREANRRQFAGDDAPGEAAVSAPTRTAGEPGMGSNQRRRRS